MGKTDNKSQNINLTYDEFRARAQDPSLSRNEKIGFPDSYRDGFEDAIIANILRHLPALSGKGKVVADIGCGCSGIADRIIALAEKGGHTLLMADSKEMLDLLPKSKAVRPMPGLFPDNIADFEPYVGKVDVIIIYSVLQHVILGHSIYRFLDEALTLLAPGGVLLLADIPSTSKRERFFASDAGVAFHKKFTGTDTDPPREPIALKPQTIDDGVIFGILQRYRNAGFETYVLPQPDTLPMHNRREDVLIVRW